MSNKLLLLFRSNDCDIKQSNQYDTKDAIAEIFMLHDNNG